MGRSPRGAARGKITIKKVTETWVYEKEKDKAKGKKKAKKGPEGGKKEAEGGKNAAEGERKAVEKEETAKKKKGKNVAGPETIR